MLINNKALWQFNATIKHSFLQLCFGYACDGPGRGGTCDLSAWDTSYLAIFWLLNTCAWIISCKTAIFWHLSLLKMLDPIYVLQEHFYVAIEVSSQY